MIATLDLDLGGTGIYPQGYLPTGLWFRIQGYWGLAGNEGYTPCITPIYYSLLFPTKLQEVDARHFSWYHEPWGIQ